MEGSTAQTQQGSAEVLQLKNTLIYGEEKPHVQAAQIRVSAGFLLL